MSIKRMTVKEFRAQGYLQELNRCFLHPLGLALEVEIKEDRIEVFGEIQDYRDEPAGVIFNDSKMDVRKAKRIQRELDKKERARLSELGYIIQPIE